MLIEQILPHDLLLELNLGCEHMNKETCYMCDSQASSREHVPPRCIFPTNKEIGRNLRSNLITVPSCDEHNSEKSKDDEFLRAQLLLGASDVSHAARSKFDTELRAVGRKPHVYASFIKSEQPIAGSSKTLIQFDRQRFDKCIEQIARAIFFHTYSRKWHFPISIFSPNIFEINSLEVAEVPNEIENGIDKLRYFLASESIKGSNPEVFKYRIRYEEQHELFSFGAIFYDSLEVFCVSENQLVHDAM
jgi:hypothetical protein